MVDLLPHQLDRLEAIRRDGASAPTTLRRKIRRIVPVEALFVSLCRSPAARSSRLVARAAPDKAGETIELATPIVRVDKARRLVYAQAYNAPWDPADGSTVDAADFVRHVDAWDTFMTADDVVACAHRFLAVSRAIDCEHDGVAGRAVVVESFVAGVGWDPWEPGAWVLGCHIPGDAEWARVEAGLADPDAEGALTGYSIQILALSEERTVDVKIETVKRTAAPETPPADPELSPADKLSLGKRILRALGFGADAVAAIERSAPPPADEKRSDSEPVTDFASAWIANQASEDLSNVLWTLRAVLSNILSSKTVTDKVGAISTAFDAARATYVAILAKAVAATSEKRSADEAAPELAHDDLRAILALDDGLDIIARVGRKMSKARLAKLKAAAAELRAVLDEVDDETVDAEEETMKSEDVKRAVIDGMREGTADLLKALREQATGTADKPADKPATETRAADAPMTPEQVAAAIKDGVAAGTKALRDELEAIKRAAPAGSAPGGGGAANGNGGGGAKGDNWYSGVFVDG